MRLLKVLRRTGAEPSVSVVAVTQAERDYDVHKDGHRDFFTANVFRDLVTGAEGEGLPGAGAGSTDRFVAGALAFAQKVRNDFLAVSANDTPKLDDFSGADPLPKRVMRAAAMAARASGRSGGPGAEHDVQEGLDLLTNELYALREKDPAYRQLQDVVSVRRHARGALRPVEPAHQLLLGEMIYDLAIGATPSGTSSEEVGGERTREGDGSIDVAADGSGAAAASAAPASESRSTTDEAARPERMGSSSAFFAHRFGKAFPGVRNISWFDDAGEIEQRLHVLLQSPLSFADGHPVWYWRGGNLQIENFRRLEARLFLMDSDELLVSRIAAVHGSTYRRHFVYVRCEAMEPTGLYRASSSDRAAAIEQFGFDYEEFGLVSDGSLVKRSEYDDGAAMINGRLVDLVGRSELRVRYTTPYNFLIAANDSPINNNRFDDVLVERLNEALEGGEREEEVVQRLRKLVEELPLRADPYA